MHDKDTVLQPLTAPAPAPRPKPIPHPSPSELESASRTGWAGSVFHMDFATSGCRAHAQNRFANLEYVPPEVNVIEDEPGSLYITRGHGWNFIPLLTEGFVP